ncbi:MAG: endonuclease Q family protein [Minisyncoccia bacterium]
MRFVADLHIHSKFSRAVSQNMVLEQMDLWSAYKGVDVLSASDFTHPVWFNELQQKLEPAEPGLYTLKKQYKQELFYGGFANTRFILSTEIENIYSKNGKVRKIHNIIFAPSLETVAKINARLDIVGNLSANGRPILGLDSKELLKILLDIDPNCFLVPAHAWTPHFGIFGSVTGFDSLQECFEELTPYIFAIETGLSSDPLMNRKLSSLDNIALISNSDSHSLQRIGREANIFNTELSYDGILNAIKSNDSNKFLMTIEFYPEEGRYHFDGHSYCNFSSSPQDTKKLNNICPVCGKPLTIGVMNRVVSLSDRDDNNAKQFVKIPYQNLIPLDEIIADSLGVVSKTKRVWDEYQNILKKFKSEINVLLYVKDEILKQELSPLIAEGILRVRNGKVLIRPGYDGEYGKINIFSEDDRKNLSQQKSLFCL